MSGAQKRIDIPTGPTRKKIAVRLVGKEYLVDPPKGAVAMKMARAAKKLGSSDGEDMSELLEILDEWIGRAFGPKAKEIQSRLDDWDDKLDIDHLMTLMQKVMEVAVGNPTTSSTGSSE